MEQTSYEVRDEATGVVLSRGQDAEIVLDQACGLLARQLGASGEGTSRMRYELVLTAVDGAARRWAGHRTYYPGAVDNCPRPGAMNAAKRSAEGPQL